MVRDCRAADRFSAIRVPGIRRWVPAGIPFLAWAGTLSFERQTSTILDSGAGATITASSVHSDQYVGQLVADGAVPAAMVVPTSVAPGACRATIIRAA